MSSPIAAGEAEEIFMRFAGERPVEPYRSAESPEDWYAIAEWERRRADFFSFLYTYQDVAEAIRRAM